jgi:hypothetical protein
MSEQGFVVVDPCQFIAELAIIKGGLQIEKLGMRVTRGESCLSVFNKRYGEFFPKKFRTAKDAYEAACELQNYVKAEYQRKLDENPDLAKKSKTLEQEDKLVPTWNPKY